MLEVSKDVMDRVQVVADSEAAWEQGTRVCCYRPPGIPEDQVMICNRVEKGSVERCKVVEDAPLVVPLKVAVPKTGAKLTRTSKHGRGKAKARFQKRQEKAKGIAPAPVDYQGRDWMVWVAASKKGIWRWQGTGRRVSYADGCAATANWRQAGKRALCLHVNSGRPDVALWPLGSGGNHASDATRWPALVGAGDILRPASLEVRLVNHATLLRKSQEKVVHGLADDLETACKKLAKLERQVIQLSGRLADAGGA